MANNGWKIVKLSEFADVTMGQSPSSDFYNTVGDGYPFLQGNRTFGPLYPIFDTWTTSLTKLGRKGDVIMSVRAPVGDLNIAPADLCLGRGVCSIRMKNGQNRFLFYLLKANIQKLLIKENGTVFSSVNKNDINSLDLLIPSDDYQKKISFVLSNIDEKIETNNRINSTLLSIAVESYKDRFGLKPKNGIIGDYCEIKSGFAFKSSWWTDQGVKVIKIGDISQDNLNISNCSFVSKENAKNASKFKLQEGDLVIAMTGATIGKFAMVPHSEVELYTNQRVGKFFIGDSPLEKLPFIYCTLKQKEIRDQIINKGQGSAQPNFSGGDVMNIKCHMPSNTEIECFNSDYISHFMKITKNQLENIKLEELKKTLLPKLMSGEIDVSKVKIEE